MRVSKAVQVAVVLGFVVSLLPLAVLGLPGQVDLTFDTATGVNLPVRILGVDPDGRVILSGKFDGNGERSRTGIARLHVDGRLDRVFAVSADAPGFVESVDFLADGRMLVSGCFTSLNGVARPSLARLLEDGTLDLGYVPASGFCRGIRLQSDGRVVAEVGDDRGLIRLEPDGRLDTHFKLGVEVESPGLVGVLADGRLLVTRAVMRDGAWQMELVRLDSGGGLDVSFSPTALDAWGTRVRWVTEQPDGKLVVHGRGLRRLNADGGWDGGFSTDQAQGWGSVDDHWLDAVAAGVDGSLYIGGRIETKHPDYQSGDDAFDLGYVRRVSSVDGRLDTDFAVTLDAGPPGRASSVDQIVVQPDGRLLVAGRFSAVNGVARRYLVRLDSRGRTDPGFDANRGAEGPVAALMPLADGTVLVGGSAAELGGMGQRSLVRLLANGAVDPRFGPILRDEETYGITVLSLARQADGRILAGTIGQGIVALSVEGSLYGSFPPTGWLDALWHSDECRALVLPDGQVLAGGIQRYDSQTRMETVGILRVEADGSPDPTFDLRPGANGMIRVLAADALGRVLVAGEFTEIAGTPRIGLARLLPDGRLDRAFDVGLRTNETVHCLAVQPDGTILVGGSGATFAGVPWGGMARLSPDGEWDRVFVPDIARLGIEPSAGVHAMAIQADGRILIGGLFDTVEGIPRRNLARLNADGSLDRSFDVGAGPDGKVSAIAVRSDGRILIGGEFRLVDGLARHHLAQLLGQPGNEVDFGLVEVTQGRPVFELAGSTVRRVTLESSDNLSTWIARGSLEVGPSPVRYVGELVPLEGRRFYRVQWGP